jgi:hypothetical protein
MRDLFGFPIVILASASFIAAMGAVGLSLYRMSTHDKQFELGWFIGLFLGLMLTFAIGALAVLHSIALHTAEPIDGLLATPALLSMVTLIYSLTRRKGSKPT